MTVSDAARRILSRPLPAWVIALAGVVWVAAMLVPYHWWHGGDLTAEYIAGILWWDGQLDAVLGPGWYHPDEALVAEIGEREGFAHRSMEFVHLPIFAALSAPLQLLGWPLALNLVRVTIAACMYATWWLSVARWAPRLLLPLPWLGSIGLLWWNFPIQFTVSYAQLHPFVLLGLVVVVQLLERRRDVPAGLVIGLVASLKLTPMGLVLPLLLLERFRAAAAAFVGIAAVLGASLLAAPVELHLAWVSRLRFIGSHTLAGPLNQSLSGAVARAVYGPGLTGPGVDPLEQNLIFQPTPVLGTVLSLATAAVGVALIWVRCRQPHPTQWGALLSILLMLTLLVPSVAWAHYGIVLLVPMAVFAGSPGRYSLGPILAFALAFAPTAFVMWTRITTISPSPRLYVTVTMLALLVLLAFALGIDRGERDAPEV